MGELIQYGVIEQGMFLIRGKRVITGRDLTGLDNTYDLWYVFGKEESMTNLTVSTARAKLYKLVDEAAASHQPIQITGRRSSAVLISEEDWRAVQETLYLISIPGMRESIRKGLKTPISKCRKEVKW